MPLRLVIADDHILFRQGLRSLLTLQTDFEITAEIDRAEDLAPALATTPCDILLLDLQMERSSLDEIPVLARQVAVIVLTASESVENGIAALRLGARAVVQKHFAIETLVTAIRAVAAGQVWLPHALQAALVHDNPAVKRLTAREREIIRLVATGLRNAEVAARLSLRESTVKTHLTNVFKKLAIRDRLELTHYAIRTGLITIRGT